MIETLTKKVSIKESKDINSSGGVYPMLASDWSEVGRRALRASVPHLVVQQHTEYWLTNNSYTPTTAKYCVTNSSYTLTTAE